LQINDDAVESITNPNDEAQNFVYQQYHDLLNREPDAVGLAYWTSQITQCGNDSACTSARRKDLSAAFYIELEFRRQGTSSIASRRRASERNLRICNSWRTAAGSTPRSGAE